MDNYYGEQDVQWMGRLESAPQQSSGSKQP